MAHKFDISLAAWSLHKMFFAKEIDQMGMVDFTAKHGISGFEMVNTFFPSPQYAYLKQLKQRADDQNVKLLLIMCDGEGSMAGPEKAGREQAAKNHHKWIDIAAVLGCHAIRCNTGAREGDADAQDRCAESFSLLLEYADAAGIDVLLENHWGLSSEPEWLVGLMKKVNHPRFGTLPDFGNFPDTVDRYDAVQAMMPYAKAVSAKCYDFDDAAPGGTGDETKVDFKRMMDIVGGAGYSGYVGIEYEGERLSERDGILACKKLLERLQ
jgi:sugar phosphate isomerase/epimerase